MQQLLISDANILIDMEEGGLLEVMFQLPYDFATPDILFVEELEEDHPHLLDLGLALKEVSAESMMYAIQLILAHVGILHELFLRLVCIAFIKELAISWLKLFICDNSLFSISLIHI